MSHRELPVGRHQLGLLHPLAELLDRPRALRAARLAGDGVGRLSRLVALEAVRGQAPVSETKACMLGHRWASV